MKHCASLFLLGLLIIPVTSDYPPGSCDGYINVTEPWRNRNFYSVQLPGFPKDDGKLLLKWLRFSGIGGDRISNSCITYNFAGTWYPSHLPFTYPINESKTPTQAYAYAYYGGCRGLAITMNVAVCPGGFYVYQPIYNPYAYTGYATCLLLILLVELMFDHSDCQPDSCGPLAQCTPEGGCVCITGLEIPPTYMPTPDAYGCVDINECQRTSGICGPYSNCNNTFGSYFCACLDGFMVPNATLSPAPSNPCQDINECIDNICGAGGTCYNNIGSFVCVCHAGFLLVPTLIPHCQDIDECFNSTVCGPYSNCTNLPGTYACVCKVGYTPTLPYAQPSQTNICIDIDECVKNATICGNNCNCTNSIGSYLCTCHTGYRAVNPAVIASSDNPCTDIDECVEIPGICGKQTVCTNVPGSVYCSCPDGFYPSTGVIWTLGVSFCQNLDDILGQIVLKEGQTKERAFFDNMDLSLKNNKDIVLPEATVANFFAASMQVSGVGPKVDSATVGSEGDGATGSIILELSSHIVSAMYLPVLNETIKQVHSSTVDLNLVSIGPESTNKNSTPLSAKANTMEINLHALASENNGSATAAFMTLSGMESLLSHQYFKTENKTEMFSDVLTAILPSMENVNLTEPVNFTIQHKTKLSEFGMVTCVYWENKNKNIDPGAVNGAGQDQNNMQWSVEGCWTTYSDENYTVCSCSHLSTFALIMQIGEPPPQDNFLEWLNRICVIVGLFFFALAILTFLLCSWNPKINNTARLHLCINLALSQLLLLWNDKYVGQKLACKVMAGLLHFLVVASFVWMLLEATQLYLLVRRLSKVQVIRRDGLPRLVLYLVGYGVPFVIVGISALVYSDGYGATESQACWLSRNRNFNWALTGPVIFVIAFNLIIFCATLWSLRPTLANMKSDVSQSKDTRLIVFKILAQFVILGCTWILGLYQSNLFFQVLFIFLNSQQGTFLYIVHCLLNKEVREEYIKWLTCSIKKDTSEQRDADSVTEDMDKTNCRNKDDD